MSSSVGSTPGDVAACDLDAIVALVRAVHGFESALQDVFAAGGALSSATADAQRGHTRTLGYLAGHQVIVPFAEAQAYVAKAIASTAEGHRKLSQLGTTQGWKFDDFGDSRKDPQSVMSILTSLVGKDRDGAVAAH